jgi:hypothetical protein
VQEKRIAELEAQVAEVEGLKASNTGYPSNVGQS